MNFGFNTNVRVGDVLYHVQTEDRGPAHPFLDTVVYQAGRVVYKRSAGYQELLAGTPTSGGLSEQLHLRLTRQHQGVIAELEAGALNLSVSPPVTAQAAVQQSRPQLEVRLLNSDSWLASGHATLHLQVWRSDMRLPAQNITVEAVLEDGGERSPSVCAQTDTDGRATVEFPVSAATGDGAGLVVRANDGTASAELRFRVRAKKRGIAPATPSK